MAFRDNQIIQNPVPDTPVTPPGPGIVSTLPASQSLNALRGRWMGSNNTPNRPPVTERRHGRGGRPPVFTPEARPLQEDTAEAAHRHRVGIPNRAQQRGQGVPNFFNVTPSHRRRRGGP